MRPKIVESEYEDDKLVAQLEELDHFIILKNRIEERRDELRNEIEEKGRISESIKDDFRFKLGQVAMINEILTMPSKARESLEN